MLSALHRLLRRRRRTVLAVLAAAFAAIGALSVHTAMLDAHAMHDAAVLCVVLADTLAVVAVVVAAVRVVAQRAQWPLASAPASVTVVRRRTTRQAARAGPSPPLLQVFRS